jgi:nitrate/nitrite transporter NarK
MPFYLVRERHFSMPAMAKIGGSAYMLAACAAALSGWWSDQWIRRGQTPTRVRKTFAAGGLGLAGIFLGLAGAVRSSFFIPLLIAGVIFFAVGSSNIWPITQTLAGAEAAGRWTGFQNFMGNLAGVSAPTLTGIVLARTGRFSLALLILTAVALVGTMSWTFLVGRVEQVAWRTRQPKQWVAAKS